MTIPARVLIIAGSDSGGGAGIQADIKTVTMLGGYAMTAITALTAQNTIGVQRVMPVPADMVVAQIDSVVRDIGVDAIKIGMIGSAEVANAVADYLSSPSFAHLLSSSRKRGPISQPESHEQAPEMGARFDKSDDRLPIVFDPVMVATSGSVLADAATIAAFGRLMRVATLTTPNLPELEALGGEAAVLDSGSALLAKGGHATGAMVEDTLITPDGGVIFANPRIDTRHTHGTGCTLSSAIATGLGQGLPLDRAVERGIAFVRAAIVHAPGLGQGSGPMGHALGRAPFDEGER
ncbi:bifunctional hydroxymethylpyrimidine kinase/phosphomethylpyrimidine kinase [Hephaestia caeni]|uniref:bifunctional hydroxymethylpyrimidine kinase/phosphomethylpyrimidine kinase n=1 Tax=Hephaestia caeni TaxID=645617 RepID=UPI001B8836AE|nr:bifunctional hydroxymethylpyrimidine kinase/phosphomethylpyrimidine kinase [Hephaestia caeni]